MAMGPAVGRAALGSVPRAAPDTGGTLGGLGLTGVREPTTAERSAASELWRQAVPGVLFENSVIPFVAVKVV